MSNHQPPIHWGRWGIVVIVFLAAGSGLAYWSLNQPGQRHFEPSVATAAEPQLPAATSSDVAVEVIHPLAGGIKRLCIQPGTVEPYESADLYAKASGFLVDQPVDIGSHVKKGDVLARISVPEYVKQVQRDQAKVKDAAAKVKQMEAHLASSIAESKAMDASITLAKVIVRAKTAYRQYREKQLTRYRELAKDKAIEARVIDEQEDFYLSAFESENAAKEGVSTAVERAAAAKSKIDQARADLDEAKAGVEVALAELEHSQVLLDYTTIKSPYTGVVTKRSFHIGDFIKSADQGGIVPLLTVERTDLMRVVIQVPDRDVPYVHVGAPAAIEIDALPGIVFQTSGSQKVGVARWADAEDSQSRTMRTEVDVPNPNGKIRRGMYGRATLTLSEGVPQAVRVPSAALFGKAEDGRGTVRIVRNKHVHLIPVHFASDNGVEVEIVAGLTVSDQVIVRANGPLEEGTSVTFEERPQTGGRDH